MIKIRKHTYEVLDALFTKPLYFQDLMLEVGISSKVLAQRTKELIAAELITRTVCVEYRIRTLYQITKKGGKAHKLLGQLRKL